MESSQHLLRGAIAGADTAEASLSTFSAAAAPSVADTFSRVSPHALPDVDGPVHVLRMTAAARRQTMVLDYRKMSPKPSIRVAAKILGTSIASLCRWNRSYDGTLGSLMDDMHKCGAKSAFPGLTEEERLRLCDIFRTSNKAEDDGSMMTACKFFALASGCRDELRDAILPVITDGRVPGPLKRILERVTPTHIGAHRRPKMTVTENFSGNVGAFIDDKRERRRVIESDDGTLNFAAWIPWTMGGDRCSDEFKVRLGRWQFLPALEAGWTHFYLGYAIVCRPRGSYRKEDVRSLIYTIAKNHGLPDKFRFERGTWESDDVVSVIKSLGVELDTVWKPSSKPFIEGGFACLWTYLSMLDGQVGRYRGDEELGAKQYQKCVTGRADPREHFPSLAQCIKAIDGALAMRNSDTIDSIYGRWIPEERHQLLNRQRGWRELPAEMEFLFCPMVREWTVAKGTVGGDVPLLEDYSAPFYFAHDELWRWNGHKVKIYFDPKATPCLATIVSLETFHGFRPGEVLCRAELIGGLPHFCRAAMGWADEQCERQVKWRSAALSALRTDLRALGPRGEIKSAVSEHRDGDGSFSRIQSGASAVVEKQEIKPTPQRQTRPPMNTTLLARQAERARAMMEAECR